MSSSLAPGVRVEIRDAEWVIRKVELTGRGQALHVTGLSDPVKDKDAIFLSDIENLRVLKPEETRLVSDDSPGYRSSLLYLESLLRQTPPTDERIYIGHRGAMDPVPYQLDPAARALKQTRQRILIADAVGLGKTLEAGILISELIKRGRGKRILVVTLKSMMTQFQKELWSRFTIPLVRLDSTAIQRVYSSLPSGQNPFHYYDRTIISMDTLKRDVQYRTFLEKAWWDIIVIDEAHNVAKRGGTTSQRAKLARLLSERSDTLILLSATPHDGRAESFASLMNMLDPTAIADPSNYGPEDIKGLFIRRFKKDVQDQVAQSFRERKIFSVTCRATPEEEQAFKALSGLRLSHRSESRTGGLLFRTVLEKSLFSSPAACLQTIRHRLGRMKKEVGPERHHDAPILEEFSEKVQRITPDKLARYQKLLETLRNHPVLFWNGKDPKDRLVVFSERRETLEFLRKNLTADFGLTEKAVEILHGGLSDMEQQRIVEQFGQESSPLRLLLAGDVASEGINLHYLCHRLVHFDIPWSLMTFQQRNGRIDRYGQEHNPLILYLVTESEDSRIKGDMRILELLIQKDKEAQENIGDPSAFLGLYDVEAEEEWTARAMESRKDPGDLEKDLLGEDDWFESFMNLAQEQEETKHEVPETGDLPSLFRDNLEYVDTALQHLAGMQDIQRDIRPEKNYLEFVAPKELERRFARYPKEIWPEHGLFRFTLDAVTMETEIQRSRVSEETWPGFHYLWSLHPALEWINDKVLSSFRRHEAPVITLHDVLGGSEKVFLLSGLVPNRKGHPLVHRWFGAVFYGEEFAEIEELESLLARTGFGQKQFPNHARTEDLSGLTKLLPEAVSKGRAWMLQRRKEFENEVNPRLDRELKALERLKGRHYEQLELSLSGSRRPEALVEGKRKAERIRIDRLFDNYLDWVQDTLTTEPEPFIQVLAVLKGA